jgi:hypothetical protein
MSFHQQEAHRVAKGIALVQALAEEVERLFMKDAIHPDNFHTWMDEKPGRETKRRFARDIPDQGQSNEFGQHITLREVTPLALEESLRLLVLGFALGVIAEESGRIEEHLLAFRRTIEVSVIILILAS